MFNSKKMYSHLKYINNWKLNFIKVTSTSQVKPSYSSTRNLLKWPNQPTCALLDQWLLTVSDEVAQVQRKYERDIQLRHAVLETKLERTNIQNERDIQLLKKEIEDLRTKLDERLNSNEEETVNTASDDRRNKKDPQTRTQHERYLLVFGVPFVDAQTEKEQVFKLLKVLQVDPVKYRSHSRRQDTKGPEPVLVIELDSNESRRQALKNKMVLRNTPGYEFISCAADRSIDLQNKKDELRAICLERNAEFTYEFKDEKGVKRKCGLEDGRRYYWTIQRLELTKFFIPDD